jgi:hypothetical protein
MGEATARECLQAAFEAIKRSDYAERDRLCDRANRLVAAEDAAAAVERALSVDFYVNRKGVAIPTLTMAKAAGAIQ